MANVNPAVLRKKLQEDFKDGSLKGCSSEYIVAVIMSHVTGSDAELKAMQAKATAIDAEPNIVLTPVVSK